MATPFRARRPCSREARPAKIFKLNGYNTAMFGKSHETPPGRSASPVRSTSGPPGWDSSGSTATWAANPTCSTRSSTTTPRWSLNRTTRTTTTKPTSPIRPSPGSRRRSHSPPISHSSSTTPRKAPTTRSGSRGVARQVQRQVRQGWDRLPGGDAGAPKEARHRPTQHPAHPQARHRARLGQPQPGREKGLRPASGTLRSVCRATDYEIGRVVQAIEDMGVLENTLIIYVTGDNGATGNGGPIGILQHLVLFQPGA